MSNFFWTNNYKEAFDEQAVMINMISLENGLENNLYQKGLAIGSAYDENTKTAIAVGVPFDFDGKSYENKSLVFKKQVDFPYVSGLLAFRVGPVICDLLDQHIDKYDLLLLDGQGIAHPRGFGLASHIGVLYNKPSIGLTKNNLFGQCNELYKGEVHTRIINPKNKNCIGYSMCKKENSQFYFSPGHKISINDSLHIIKDLIMKENSYFPKSLLIAHTKANKEARKVWINHKKHGNTY